MGIVAAIFIALGIIMAIGWAMYAAQVRKISNVPFRKVSEIAQQGVGAADRKGMVSFEGKVIAQPIQAPMSGKPVLFYEYEITRHWEKAGVGSDGKSTTQTGSDSFMKQKQGIVFQVTDGAGTIAVDASGGVSDTEKLHEQDVRTLLGVVPMTLELGGVNIQYPKVPAHDKTTKFRGVEKGVPHTPDMNVYVLGKLGQGPAGLTVGGTTFGNPTVSTKSREETLGAAAKNAHFAKLATAGFLGLGVVVGLISFLTAAPAKPDAAATGGAAQGASSAAVTAATTTAVGSAAPATTAPAHTGATPAHTAPAHAAPPAHKK